MAEYFDPQDPELITRVMIERAKVSPNPVNQMLFDLASEHRKVIHGAVFQAVREITGRDVDIDDLRENLVMEQPESHDRWVRYVYRGEVIIVAHRPECSRRRDPISGKWSTVIFQRVEQPWKHRAWTPGMDAEILH